MDWHNLAQALAVDHVRLVVERATISVSIEPVPTGFFISDYGETAAYLESVGRRLYRDNDDDLEGSLQDLDIYILAREDPGLAPLLGREVACWEDIPAAITDLISAITITLTYHQH